MYMMIARRLSRLIGLAARSPLRSVESRSLLQFTQPDALRYSTFFPGAKRPAPSSHKAGRVGSIDPDIDGIEDYFEKDALPISQDRTDPDFPTEEEVRNATIPTRLSVLFIRFTCKGCDKRHGHFITLLAYEEGTIVIFCPECRIGHVLVDHLQAFPESVDSMDIDKVLELIGNTVALNNRAFIRDFVLELRPAGPMSPEEFAEYLEELDEEAAEPADTDELEAILSDLDEDARAIAIENLADMANQQTKHAQASSGHDRPDSENGEDYPEDFKPVDARKRPSGQARTKASDYDDEEFHSSFFTNSGNRSLTPANERELINMPKEQLKAIVQAELRKYAKRKKEAGK